MKKLADKPIIKNTAVICVCFLLTSTGYLAWVYHLMELVPPQVSDAVSMVAGYALQALGIGLFSLCLRCCRARIEQFLFAALFLHLLCMIPAVLSPSLALTLAAGSAVNLLCGWIAGYYLYRLSCGAEAGQSAVTLGIGYALSILASWLLSIAGNGTLYYSGRILVVCLALTAAACAVIRIQAPVQEAPEGRLPEDGTPESAARFSVEPAAVLYTAKRSVQDPAKSPARPAAAEAPGTLLLFAALLILLFSIVNNCGFAFPASDLENGISLEFSRLFYAAGLLIAGFVNDRSRKHGAICALTALVVPFLMLALRGEPVPMLIFWALSYFTFGFYSVFRMVLFSDLARDTGILYLSGFGLLAGRAGDAAGEALCLSLADRLLPLLCISTLLFMAATFLFFRIYPLLYMPAAVPAAGGSASPAQASDPRSVSEAEIITAEASGQAAASPPVPAADTLPTSVTTTVPAAPPVPAQPQPVNEQETFQRFCAQYRLSIREREVLRFLLAEKTNGEIAGLLSISEGTVKYHIHNLLQKTGCKNRIALIAAYYVGGKEPS